MATITQTIGSAGGRDFATLQLWANALPTNSADNYIGNIFPDSEFSAGVTVPFLGTTPPLVLQAATGQSFRDNVNVRTNALFYNSANGVAITSAAAFSPGIFDISHPMTINGLQIRGTGGSSLTMNLTPNTGNLIINNCILESDGQFQVIRAAIGGGQAITLNNCLVVATGASNTNRVISMNTNGSSLNLNFCTIVASSSAAPPPAVLEDQDGASVTNIENCALFGCTTVKAGTGTFTFTTCMTDVSSPPSGMTGSLSYTAQFVNITNDFQQKAGAALRGAGTADPTNGATDISGFARPNLGNWDIGAWEFGTAVSNEILMGQAVM